MKNIQKFLALTSVVVAVIFSLPLPVFAASGKVASSPNSVTVAEGSSVSVDIKLSQPIICPDPNDCSVQLSFTSPEPSLTTISPATLTFAPLEWSNTKQITINNTDDGLASGDRLITIELVATGTATYYNGFRATIPTTIIDSGRTPAPAPIPAAASIETNTATQPQTAPPSTVTKQTTQPPAVSIAPQPTTTVVAPSPTPTRTPAIISQTTDGAGGAIPAPKIDARNTSVRTAWSFGLLAFLVLAGGGAWIYHRQLPPVLKAIKTTAKKQKKASQSSLVTLDNSSCEALLY